MLREKELQAIGKAAIEADVLGGTLEACLVASDVRALLATIRELQAQVPRWIPVSERLPEVVKHGEYGVSAYVFIVSEHDIVEISTINCAGFWARKSTGKVVAWMPIPDTSQVLGGAE